MITARKTWAAPAKLNLFLHITGRRDDGYHLLQSVFQFLDYADELEFDLRDDGLIALETDFPDVPHEQNLIVKAARSMQHTSAKPMGVSIHIKKILPIGGGLGGGSSNAATTMVALNKLWNCGLDKNQLAEIGLKLGADVPVFIHGHAAWAEGVGESVKGISLPEPWFVVVWPGVEISTQEVFSNASLTRDCSAIKIRDFLEGQQTQNVCQPVVIEAYPEVAKALDFLDTTPSLAKARMTGTGSSVFASYSDKESAEQALNHLPKEWLGFVAKGCNISPLYSSEV